MLHHVGCGRLVPGMDHRDFVVFGEVMPPLDRLDSKCLRCFGTVALEEPADDESAAESLDSSSSSSSAQEPAPKKSKKKAT